MAKIDNIRRSNNNQRQNSTEVKIKPVQVPENIQKGPNEEPTVDIFKKKKSKVEIISENSLSQTEEQKLTKRVKLDKNRNEFFAPFDLFGVSAKFYIDGRNRTLTWIGCFCSLLLVGLILTLFVFQISWHVGKTDSIVTSFESEVEGNELFDMQAGQQILAIQYQHMFLPNNPFLTFVGFDVTHVTESTKKGTVETRPLSWLPCEQTNYYRESSLLRGNSICVEFSEPTMIGRDPKNGLRQYI